MLNVVYFMVDSDLVFKFLNDDLEAFAELIRKYELFAYKYAYTILLDSNEAEDAVSESFLKAYENIRKFQLKTSFKNWLLKIVHNTCIDILRKNKKITYVENSDYIFEAKTKTENFEIKTLNKEILDNALKNLSYDMRAVIVLRFYYDYDYQTICSLLDIPIGTLSSRLNRGLSKLKEFLTEDNNEN